MGERQLEYVLVNINNIKGYKVNVTQHIQTKNIVHCNCKHEETVANKRRTTLQIHHILNKKQLLIFYYYRAYLKNSVSDHFDLDHFQEHLCSALRFDMQYDDTDCRLEI